MQVVCAPYSKPDENRVNLKNLLLPVNSESKEHGYILDAS